MERLIYKTITVSVVRILRIEYIYDVWLLVFDKKFVLIAFKY